MKFALFTTCEYAEWHDLVSQWKFAEAAGWDAVFIDDKELRSGPPPSYEKIKKRIAKKVKKL